MSSLPGPNYKREDPVGRRRRGRERRRRRREEETEGEGRDGEGRRRRRRRRRRMTTRICHPSLRNTPAVDSRTPGCPQRRGELMTSITEREREREREKKRGRGGDSVTL